MTPEQLAEFKSELIKSLDYFEAIMKAPVKYGDEHRHAKAAGMALAFKETLAHIAEVVGMNTKFTA
jgi:hypothetical protein